MWTPDVVFENQVTLDRAMSAIKNESDSVVEIKTLDCLLETKTECENLNLTSNMPVNGTRLFFKQTVNVEVNCPNMEFGSFPFDSQVCDFLVKDLKLKETKDSTLKSFQWEAPHLLAGHELTSPEYDISVENPLVSGYGASRLNSSFRKFYKIYLQVRLQGKVGEEEDGVHLHLLPPLLPHGDGQLGQLCSES